MIRFRKLKVAVSPLSTCLLTVFSATPAFADGFTRANTVMEKVSTGLHGLAAITITVAVIWVGYKTLWKGESLSQCAYIIIGGILIGGGSEIGALLMS
ncbi:MULTISPECIES: TrbC/VirB2 family protein [Enterobacterales]|uniref:TrbC/VirB2 family protein n=1 Tax=Dickeya solani TaxID=1089444 RepID=A0AAX4EYK3_9GAMM|nr:MULTISPECIES: TrbC/VirB2 family protein [Enterobacterales]MCA6938437.1 TrbC/VirB2 family protein [Pectobacterium versatile]PVY71214.1 type IV secretion system protein VirB2 [Pectobacterium versatile]TAI88820.1 TriB protein [Pectobacterium versatile]WEJ85033.1 MAG: TrbC/VirB2 family protein [Kluyvera intermedia]WOA52318.1 TrbC/VirB2 family protein [Dickeya solani]